MATISPVSAIWRVNATRNTESYSDASIKSTKPEYYEIETPKIKYGRALNAMDEHNKSKVCVIGKRVYENLFLKEEIHAENSSK